MKALSVVFCSLPASEAHPRAKPRLVSGRWNPLEKVLQNADAQTALKSSAGSGARGACLVSGGCKVERSTHWTSGIRESL